MDLITVKLDDTWWVYLRQEELDQPEVYYWFFGIVGPPLPKYADFMSEDGLDDIDRFSVHLPDTFGPFVTREEALNAALAFAERMRANPEEWQRLLTLRDKNRW